MTTIEELITSCEIEEEQAVKKRDRAIAEVKTILAKARQEGRSNLTDDEDADVSRAFERRDAAKRDLSGIQKKLARARQTKEAEEEVEVALHDKRVDTKTTAGAREHESRAVITRDERTYHRGMDRNGKLFLREQDTLYVYDVKGA